MLTAAALFFLLPLGIVFGTVLGDKLGAKTPLLLLPPLPVMVIHGIRLSEGGTEALVASATASLASLPMVFTWAVPFFWVVGALRARGPLAGAVALVLASGIATGLQQLLRPWWMPISEDPVLTCLAAIPLLALGHLLMWLPPQERAAVAASASLRNGIARVASLLLILVLLWSTATGPAHGVHVVLASVPRMTLELATSTALVSGAVAARQVLWGLPIGLGGAVGWCMALVALTGPLGAAGAMGVGLAWVVGWWVVCFVRAPWRAPQRQ